MILISFDTESIVVYIPPIIGISPFAVNATIVTDNKKVDLTRVTINCTDD
jgi:hypothetical protein